jgi:heptosyltransferase-2
MIRTLVIAPQWIGDAVMSEPLLARLAARGERVAVAALPWVAPVYRAIPHVAEVIELPFAHGRLDWAARRRLARAWRGRFDRAYVLPNSIKSALLPWLARIPERVGYRGEGRFGLLNRRLANAGGRPPMVAFYGALADAADPRDGGDAPMRETPRLAFADAEIDGALGTAGLRRGAYWVFAPGAEYGPAKRWPPARYAELARALHGSSGLPVVLLGSAAEAPLCAEIAAAAGAACRVFAGALPLVQAMALIAAARGVVSNDSGLMHVAAAFGVPQVAVFGSTSPLHTPPLSARANVLWLKDELGLDCMPCFERTCRYGHYRCLTSVSAGRVEAALAVALAAPPADAAHATA